MAVQNIHSNWGYLLCTPCGNPPVFISYLLLTCNTCTQETPPSQRLGSWNRPGLQDRPAIPELSRHGSPGSIRGLLSRTLRGHQLVRHPRQACHHHAKGHPAGKTYPWRTRLSCFTTQIQTNGLFQGHHISFEKRLYRWKPPISNTRSHMGWRHYVPLLSYVPCA